MTVTPVRHPSGTHGKRSKYLPLRLCRVLASRLHRHHPPQLPPLSPCPHTLFHATIQLALTFNSAPCTSIVRTERSHREQRGRTHPPKRARSKPGRSGRGRFYWAAFTHSSTRHGPVWPSTTAGLASPRRLARPSPPPVTTATAAAQKRRKLGFARFLEDSSDVDASATAHQYDPRASSSPPAPHLLPPAALLPAARDPEADSPSGALAAVTIDSASTSASTGDMSGSEHPRSPARVLGARSASPAKRRASDMEGDVAGGSGGGGNGERSSPKSQEVRTVVSHDGVDEAVTNGGAAAVIGEGGGAPPPYEDDDGSGRPNEEVVSIDEQVRVVRGLIDEPLDEGQRGFVVSARWLSRVLSRSSETDTTYSKDAMEGSIGQVDNTDIVPEGSFAHRPLLKDAQRHDFIPLKPGLAVGVDFQVLPERAWGNVLHWYGLAAGQKQIARYARNTAPDALVANIIYEIYPPVITIRKVAQLHQPTESPTAPSTSVGALRLRDERRDRGQSSPDDPIRFVASRTERFQKFLRRSKEAAEIPLSTRVKCWKLTQRPTEEVDRRANGVPSPPVSRDTSPHTTSERGPRLVIDLAAWKEMDQVELLDAKDETHNANYNGHSSLEVYGLFEDVTLVLEEQIGGPAGGEFPSDQKKKIGLSLPGLKVMTSKPSSASGSRRSSPAPGGMITRGRQKRDGRTRGTVGLNNLGNTCYMNSALQCIRSVEELSVYFLSGRFKSEINNNNPLGYNGQMAKRYAEVLGGIYGDNTSTVFSPGNFKRTLGTVQPLFSGYGQQDSQEFLSFLVDALHEDLNRIIQKPYNENPDSNDDTVNDPQAIVELGETYRANHRARNDSVAMDLFNGFYKNTMECPECNKISITFDPFSLLTVQLPIENTLTHEVAFLPRSGPAVLHAIDMDRNASVKTLKQYIASRHPDVRADRLWMAEVYSNRIYKVFDDAATLGESGIADNDYLWMFELEDVPSNLSAPAKRPTTTIFGTSSDEDTVGMDDPRADRFAVPVFSRGDKSWSSSGWILHPFYIQLTREEAMDYDTVLKKTLIAVSRLTSLPILTTYDDAPTGIVTARVKEEEATEDPAQVSDRSLPSEDEYVEVSMSTSSEGAGPSTPPADPRAPPEHFMDAQYFINPTLRNLFTMNSAKAADGGLHCSGLSSINDQSITNMYDRVKQSVRPQSSDSTTSGEHSSMASPLSAVDANESEADTDMDKPDLTIGEVNIDEAIHMASDSESTLDNGLHVTKPGGRRRRGGKGKRVKGLRNKVKTYGKADKRVRGFMGLTSRKTMTEAHAADENDPYYIKLGEGIVLDWNTEFLSRLFGNDPQEDTQTRGHYVSHDTGRDLPRAVDPELQEKRAQRASRKRRGITLEDCFVETGKREVLSEDNAWYCGRCRGLRRATKTLEIWTIPDILVVHLKRFGGNRSFRDKIDVMVDYPAESLDMTDRVGLREPGKEYVYDLFAVDNHYGGLGGGHYTATAKNFYDEQWYEYNDGSCHKIGAHANRSAAAYLLFYRRRSDRPLGPAYLQDLVAEAHNPSATTGGDDDAEAAGEDALGGLNGLLRSSSDSTTAAATASTPFAAPASVAGGAGALPPAANSPTMTTATATVTSPTKPSREPPAAGTWSQADVSWGFETLARSGNDNVAAADDADSTTALHSDVDMLDREPGGRSSSSPPTNDARFALDADFADDHGLYTGARFVVTGPDGDDGDGGSNGRGSPADGEEGLPSDGDVDPAPVDIYPDPPGEGGIGMD